jgi:hypothetical protein
LSFKTRLIGGASALALAGSVMVFATPAGADLDLVKADNQIVRCTGTALLATLNPTLGSGDAKYVKAANKRNDGTVNHLSLTGGEDLGNSTTDATSCAIDSGIRTTNAATDAGTKLNPYDNQTPDGSEPGGFATLDMGQVGTGALTGTGKISGVVGGSASCNRTDPGLVTDYPRGYPLNGKLIYKFQQLTATGAQYQIQAYVRLGTDDADPDITHITVNGTVIKGPGIGGDVTSTLAFGAAYAPTKNINLLDCTADGTPPAAGNASLASLIITPADGSDADASADPFDISIPA